MEKEHGSSEKFTIWGKRIPEGKINSFDPEDVTVVELDSINVSRKGVECLGVPVDSMMKVASKLSTENTQNDTDVIKVVDMLVKMAGEAKKASQ
jgi:hypothetical protein